MSKNQVVFLSFKMLHHRDIFKNQEEIPQDLTPNLIVTRPFGRVKKKKAQSSADWLWL